MSPSLRTSRRPRHTAALAAAAFAAASATAPFAVAATVTATYLGGPAGTWENPAVWTKSPANAGYPNNAGATTFDAVVNGGNVALNSAATIQKLTLGGTLSGTGTLNLNELLTWTNGSIGGTAVVNANGGALINGGSNRTITGTLNLKAGQIANWVNANINASSHLATINNAGTFQIQPDANLSGVSLAGSLTTRSTFNNTGLLSKAAGPGTTDIGWTLNNSGTVSATIGTLRMSGGGQSTGRFTAGPLATLEFAGISGGSNGATLLPGSAVVADKVVFSSGFTRVQGTYAVGTSTTINGPTFFDAPITNVGATLTVNNGLTVFASNALWSTATLNVTGGLSVNGPVIVTSLLNLDDGGLIINGGGTLFANAATTISGDAFSSVSGHLRTLGASTWSGNGNLAVSAATIDNAGTFAVTGDGDVTASGGDASLLKNSGTFLKTGGAGVTEINAPFANTGTVGANVGTLRFTRGGTNNGRIGGAAGTVEFGGAAGTPTYTSAIGRTIDATHVRVTDKAILNVLGTYAAKHTTVTGNATFHPSGPQAYPAGSTLDVSGGEVYLDSDAGSAASATLGVHASAGKIYLNTSQHFADLDLDGTAQADITPAGLNQHTVVTRALAITGNARLDLGANQLVVDYAGPASPLPAVRAMIASGYNAAGTKWTGPGIVSTLAQSNPDKALGYGEAAVALAIAPNATAPWLGNTVDGTSVLIRMTKFGDANLDGAVDFNDLVKLAQNYDTGAADRVWTQGDFTYDGLVDFNDLVKLAQNYETALPNAAAIPGATPEFARAFSAAAAASVPEPSAALTALAACGLAALGRRRRAATPGKVPA